MTSPLVDGRRSLVARCRGTARRMELHLTKFEAAAAKKITIVKIRFQHEWRTQQAIILICLNSIHRANSRIKINNNTTTIKSEYARKLDHATRILVIFYYRSNR